MAPAPLHLANRAALAALLAGAAFSGWFVACGGLLLEPVGMEVLGDCGEDCTRVRCVFQNQAPIAARGDVVVDAWNPRGSEGRDAGAGRQRRALALQAREQTRIDVEFPGVAYRPGRTMVRCMPWYAAGMVDEP